MAEKSLKLCLLSPTFRQGQSTWESLPANLQYFHSKNPNSSSAKPCKISSLFGFYWLIFTKWTSCFTEATVSVSCGFVHHVTPPVCCCNYCGYSTAASSSHAELPAFSIFTARRTFPGVDLPHFLIMTLSQNMRSIFFPLSVANPDSNYEPAGDVQSPLPPLPIHGQPQGGWARGWARPQGKGHSEGHTNA